MEQLSFFSIEKKIQNAITLLKMFEAKAIEMHPEGYYLCFSGGKDSQVIYELAKQAKVKFQVYYNVTTVDPPELVYFIRKMYPAVIINQPDTTMWELISQKHYPPTRRMRYCCSELKERGGKGRFVVTGVRWAESRKRRKRGFAEIQGPSEPKVILNSDNDEKRRQIENCQIKGKRVLNPILVGQMMRCGSLSIHISELIAAFMMRALQGLAVLGVHWLPPSSGRKNWRAILCLKRLI